MWTVPISNMRGWIKFLWLKLYVCLILTSCCSLSNGWISITIRNVDHYKFMHKRLNENKNVDCFNFKHDRLNKNFLIIAQFLKMSNLKKFLRFSPVLYCFKLKHERLNENSLILTLCFPYLDFLMWDMDHFNFKHQRLNKSS